MVVREWPILDDADTKAECDASPDGRCAQRPPRHEHDGRSRKHAGSHVPRPSRPQQQGDSCEAKGRLEMDRHAAALFLPRAIVTFAADTWL